MLFRSTIISCTLLCSSITLLVIALINDDLVTTVNNIFIGILGSAVVTLVFSFSSAKSKYSQLIEDINFVMRNVKWDFDDFYKKPESSAISILRSKQIEHFQTFYKYYKDIEFVVLINWRQKKYIQDLFHAYQKFFSHFINEKSDRFLFELAKPDFQELMRKYLAICQLNDPDLLEKVIEWDESRILTGEFDSDLLPLTLKQIRGSVQ